MSVDTDHDVPVTQDFCKCDYIDGKRTTLMFAADCGCNNALNTIKTLLECGEYVNTQNKSRWTALMLAVQSKGQYSETITRVLIDAKANANTQQENGDTALILAIKNRKENALSIIKLLLEAGVDVNLQKKDGNTALTLAVQYGGANAEAMMKLLIRSGANVNAQKKDGNTALTLATHYGGANAEAMIRVLIDAGANVDIRNRYGDNALSLASSYIDFHDWKLHNRWIGIYGGGVTPRCKSFSHCMVIKTLIEAEANVNGRFNNGDTLLTLAAKHSAENDTCEILSILIEAGANVNDQNNDGETALAIAIGCRIRCECDDHVKNVLTTIRMLINAGADANARERAEHTILMKVASDRNNKRGAVEMLTLLIEAGANVNTEALKHPYMRHSFSVTALMLSADRSPIDTMRVLIDKGSNINWSNENGHTALSTCVYNLMHTSTKGSSYGRTLQNSKEKIRMLIEAGANVNMRDKNGETVLMLIVKSACNHGRKHVFETIQMLIDAGADVNIRDNNGNTALMLLYNRLYRDEMDYRPVSLPHLKVKNAKIIMTFLMNANADFTIQNKDGFAISQQETPVLPPSFPRPSYEPSGWRSSWENKFFLSNRNASERAKDIFNKIRMECTCKFMTHGKGIGPISCTDGKNSIFVPKDVWKYIFLF